MDPKLASILGITTPASNPAPPLIPARIDRTQVNLTYKKLGVPPIAKSGNAQVVQFHDEAALIIAEEARAAVEALHGVSDELRPEIRGARMVGIMRLAAQAMRIRLAHAAAPLAATIYKAREVVDKAMNRQPDDPIKAVFWFSKVADARQQVARMSEQDRIKVVHKLAERADEVFPALVLDSLTPVIPENLVPEMTRIYQAAFAGDQVRLLEDAEDALEEVKAVIFSAELALSAATSGLGIPRDWTKVSTPEIVKAWPGPTKGKFIAERGEEAYQALLQGREDIETALGFFRPGLKEA